MSKIPGRCLIRYDRRGDLIRLTLTGMTNHELREVICGLWARLDDADRRDHLDELSHYADYLAAPADYPDRHLSDLAETIRKNPGDAGTIDLSTHSRRPKGTT